MLPTELDRRAVLLVGVTSPAVLAISAAVAATAIDRISVKAQTPLLSKADNDPVVALDNRARGGVGAAPRLWPNRLSFRPLSGSHSRACP